MKKFIPSLIICFSLLGGIGWGILLLILLPQLPIKPNHILYKTFGIRKPQIIGFAPFWLFDKAQNEYAELSTFTYFGLTLDKDGTIVKLVNAQEEEPGWTFLNSEKLKSQLQLYQQKKATNSLLIHMSNESSISALLTQPQLSAQNLVNEAAPLMQKHGFSDLNLDIESFVDATDSAKQNFTTYIKNVSQNLKNTNPQRSLTLELPVRSLFKPTIYDPLELGKSADFIVLMAYDFHYSGSFVTGPVAPLGGAADTREIDVESLLLRALSKIPKDKLILGIPLYGYEWETISAHRFAAAIPGSGATASNKRINELLKTCTNCEYFFDAVSQSPIILMTDPKTQVLRQIYYEDKDSLSAKLNLAKKYELGGVAFWAMGYEGNDMLNPLGNYQHEAFW